ncbi:MAG TPA: LamG domain-containing protein, partial [Sedimentisphaerales bacterium]|nr:LamG domain-containing protein [Sedimentisphaerales bacterium]
VWQDVNDANGDGHQQDIPDMNDLLHVGLVVTSHNADLICSADFDELAFKPPESSGEFLPWGFIGNIGLNAAEQLYVALEDGTGTVSVVNNPDPNAATATDWQEWNIALTEFANVDFNDVRKVYIGLGDRDTPTEGGKGIVYFDDFRTCPPRCVPLIAKPYADIAGPGGVGDGYYDCVVDEEDMAVLLLDWLLPDEYITAVAPSEPNLLLHWAFNEGSGTTAIDSAGVVNGVISGATYSSPGPDGSAYCLDFDGGGDYVYVVDGNDVNDVLDGLGGLTVSMWIKSDVTGTDKGFISGEVPHGSDETVTMRYDVAGASYGGENVIKMGLITTGGDLQLESSENVQTTNWQHLVMTWSSGQEIRLYIDGLEDTPTGRDDGVVGTLTDVEALIVGKGGKDVEAYQGWDGLIDDLRIYDYPLSKEEVAYLATNGGAGIHLPIDSPANLSNTEAPGSQWINFRDYSIIAGSWLEKVIWP